jgi:hypothetical protein
MLRRSSRNKFVKPARHLSAGSEPHGDVIVAELGGWDYPLLTRDGAWIPTIEAICRKQPSLLIEIMDAVRMRGIAMYSGCSPISVDWEHWQGQGQREY